ncbi:MAG TPA: hypothetical protein VGA67_04625 [Candidatus Dojkabacteria bacterium]|jgi:hypothetical protein
MKTEPNYIKTSTNPKIDTVDNHSVCQNSQEKYRLQKLFEIFIDIDESIKKKLNESYNRNTNYSSQA